ncbi:cell filamentation protein Fic-related protein [Bifidobacterium saguini DSM 23967]|uniref:protein adenylyltransferase n=2 Tax=Bifidobacterium saguini TaxID=762210 RepID=A0A087D5Q4_9BIFI|nr:Fic family protein [Bifidobacterium saguini]KFI90854.1 cell filamentation protein Fic-related protein [Bifidobacterium saguini DSM 23967]
MIDGYQVPDPNGTRRSREYGWSVGFGLQRADGLTPSEYAYDVARRQVNGDISYNQAALEIAGYHIDHPEQAEHFEADIVSQRISELLQTTAFAFSSGALRMIHKRLFKGVLPREWTGEWRYENITKSEPVLHGETVQYSDYMWIEPTLDYDFSEEKKRQGGYQRTDRRQVADSVFSFLSGIWQIHPFREGNTRATAAFGILYLRFLGFDVGDEPFVRHSQYLRDALALANVSDPASRDDGPLHDFTQALLFDPSIRLASLRESENHETNGNETTALDTDQDPSPTRTR